MLRDVGRSYRDRRGRSVRALDGVSVRAAPGELLALVGPSGCGKSTLLELVCGLQSPDEGSVASAPAPVAVAAPDVSQHDRTALAPSWRGARGRLQLRWHVAPFAGITPQVLRVGAGGIASRTPSQPAFPPAPLVST